MTEEPNQSILKTYFPPKKVEELAKEIIKEATKQHDEAIQTFYNSLENSLYEHYENLEERVKYNLIREITEEFVKNPKDSRFKDLRIKLFKENQDLFIPLLTEEQVTKEVEDVLFEYTFRPHYWNNRWNEKIANFILKNINDYAENETIRRVFTDQLKNQKHEINRLKDKISELTNVLED
jgi:polyhydroxyalkanoate synthesis regulator phasin